MDIQEYTELIYKLKKYYKLNKIHNTDKYQQKIKRIGEKLGNSGIIQFGGVLSHNEIKDLLKDTPENISARLNLELDLELYKTDVDNLVKNDELILTIIEDYKKDVLKLKEEKDKCFTDLETAKTIKDPAEINLLETKLKEKISILQTIVSQIDEKNIKKVKEELSDYLSKKTSGTMSESETMNLSSPVREIIEGIDKFLK